MIACIRILYFATTIVHKAQPDTVKKPLILTRYRRVDATCETASERGVKAGMSLRDALISCPDANFQTIVPSQTRRALHQLLDIFSDYGWRIEVKRRIAQTAVIYLDIDKLMPDEVWGVAQEILKRLWEQGFKVSIGIASGKFTAYVAASNISVGKCILIHKWQEAAYLAPLSTAYLPLNTENRYDFELLELDQIGQVASLSRGSMLQRFGHLGALVHRLACGEERSLMRRYIPLVNKTVSHQFDLPMSDSSILESTLADLVGEISNQLRSDGMACNRLLLNVCLDDNSEQEIAKRLYEPVRGKEQLYRIVRRLMDKLWLTRPIITLTLQVDKLTPIQPRQLSLFDPPYMVALEERLIQLTEQYKDTYFYRVTVYPHSSLLPEEQMELTVVEIT